MKKKIKSTGLIRDPSNKISQKENFKKKIKL